jgi:NAD(P)-dependent dehydrogenase (short-subunit alcohol dehydrogenase family)
MSPDILARAVVITGASTGIGRAIASKVVAEGGLAFAGVRKQADFESLKAQFGDRVFPLLFDVTDEQAVRAAVAVVQTELGARNLFGLVNNAGVAVPGPLLELETADVRRQIEINLIGVHTVTRAFAPLLGAEPLNAGPKGRIVMMSSVAGKMGQPFVGPYVASKHALEGYSDSLRRELMLFGVDVIVIGPGAIATPIWGKGEDEADDARMAASPYKIPMDKIRKYFANAGANGLPAEDVGALVWRVLTIEKPKARYAIMRRPLQDGVLPRLLPKRVVDNLVAKRLGLTKQH